MYRAIDVRLGRKVALKVIGEHLGADDEFRERFVDEARNTSAIDHANVVPLYDFGEIDGMHYIAMRLVDGADLASLIAEGPIVPDRTLKLLDQVADALDSMHNRGLVHLDVKPANVLVTSRESAREHVYVADFGLTRRGATGHHTRGGDFLGSPTYAAPEHLRGEPVDGRTDQYALACVLFACLTGNPPFQGDVPAVIKGHLAGEPPSVSRSPGLSPAIDSVIRRGMAKDPADRYGSCGELISAAHQALGAGATSERPRPPSPVGPPTTPPAGPPTGLSSGEGGPTRPYPLPRPPNRPQPGQAQSVRPQPGQAQPQPLRPQPGWGQQPGYGFPPPGPPQQPYPAQGHPQQHASRPQPGYPQPAQQPYGTPPFGSRPPGPAPGYQPPPGPQRGGLRCLWIALAVLGVAGAAVLVIVLLPSGGPSSPLGTVPEIPDGPTGGETTVQPSSSGLPPPAISIGPSS